jgi:hypothetical protein
MKQTRHNCWEQVNKTPQQGETSPWRMVGSFIVVIVVLPLMLFYAVLPGSRTRNEQVTESKNVQFEKHLLSVRHSNLKC